MDLKHHAPSYLKNLLGVLQASPNDTLEAESN